VSRWGTYYPKKYKDWLAAATEQLKGQGPTMEGPLAVTITVLCVRPKNPANPYPVGDVDNYAKAALDALQHAGILPDDKHVVGLQVFKAYAVGSQRSGTFIEITHT